jgi:hypothetical protein
MKQPLISPHWSAQDALALVAFLEQIVAAIWQTHGRVMAQELQRARLLADVGEQEDLCSDDIPF